MSTVSSQSNFGRYNPNQTHSSRFALDQTQRFKYLGAIKPGISGSSQQDEVEPYMAMPEVIRAPTHFIDDECFVFQLPLMLRGKCPVTWFTNCFCAYSAFV